MTLDLALQTITETGFGPVSYGGIETVVVDANAALTVVGTADNDVYDVAPLSAGNNGRFAHNFSPGALFRYTDAASVTFAGGTGGDDVLNVFGNEAANLITSGASTITVDGSTVTAAANIDELNVRGLGGLENIDLSLFSLPIRVGIWGGDGDDIIIGSPNSDVVYGGAGNDTISGLAGVDTIYGEDGNDTITGGTGNDRLFGGDGSDTFIWNNGDNTDLIEGDEGVDVQIVNGAAAGDAFSLSATGSGRLLFARTNLVPFTIDMGGVEQVDVNGLAGADSFLVADLTQSDVRVVNLDLGAVGDTESVTVEGRTTSDQLMVSTAGAGLVAVTGLRYDIHVAGAEPFDGLTVNGNEGADAIHVEAGVENVITTTLNGGAGDDKLSGWFRNANGNDGNDSLVGMAITQTMDGGGGDDTFYGNGGTIAVGGGAAGLIGDTIPLPGTPGNDVMTLALNPVGHLLATINGVTTTYTNFIGGPIATSGVEKTVVQGGLGNDPLTVDSTNGAIPLAITFDGGEDTDSLRLTGGTATLDIYSPGPNPGQGVSLMVIGGVTQMVSFHDLEPVVDLVGGPLVVDGNHASNAVNYDQSPNNPAWGRVSIDLLESIEFANKIDIGDQRACRRRRRQHQQPVDARPASPPSSSTAAIRRPATSSSTRAATRSP